MCEPVCVWLCEQGVKLAEAFLHKDEASPSFTPECDRKVRYGASRTARHTQRAYRSSVEHGLGRPAVLWFSDATTLSDKADEKVFGL